MAPSKAVGKVAIIGDDLVGTETALMLGQEGKDVTIVEMRNGIALEDEPLSQIALNTELDAAGVKSLVNAKMVNDLKLDGVETHVIGDAVRGCKLAKYPLLQRGHEKVLKSFI